MHDTGQPSSEEEIERLEKAFVAAAGWTFFLAHKRARLDFPVVVAEGGQIVELTPGGQRRLIKTIQSPCPSTPGEKYIIE